ncbi:MAG: hypothetical protein WC593_15210 [Methanoregula sp.]
MTSDTPTILSLCLDKALKETPNILREDLIRIIRHDAELELRNLELAAENAKLKAQLKGLT